MVVTDLPDGVVTFLMTDIRGSTRLWEEHPGEMGSVLDRHDALIDDTVAEHGGTLIRSKGEGDSTFSVFASPDGAIAAAVRVQRAISDERWPGNVRVQIRAAVHTGEAERRDDDYFGLVLSRCARLRAVAHGGQTLCSHATREALGRLPPGVTLRDLGLHRLRDLARAERIYQVCDVGLPDAFPPLESLDVRHNLPVQRTSFVGRDGEAGALAALLAADRLVTLVGVGGCGKTRLAVEVAWKLLSRFPDGVFFVDLSPVSDPALIPATAAAAVGFSRPTLGTDRGGPAEELIEFLSTRDVLLVLDNCEHVVGACAELANRILRTCPDVTILATSREGLAIDGERTFNVPPLSGPDDDLPETADSVKLFYERATLAHFDFVPTTDNVADVVEICERLDGIPLAIELAAAQVAYLSPRQIVEHLGDRFGLLTGGPRHAQRQQTLRAAIDWSHDRLDDDEQLVLRRLSVFPGSFSLDAAAAVCGVDAVSAVRSLVAKSLMTTEDGPDVRYRLLETIRVYAEEQMDSVETSATRDRHRDHYVAWAESVPAEHTFLDPDGVIRLEQHNLRAAMGWSEQQERLDLVGRIASTMNRIWLSNVPEGRRWLGLALEGVDDLEDDHRVRVLTEAAQVAVAAIEARDGMLAERAVAASGGRPGMWSSLAHGLLCLNRGVQQLMNGVKGEEVEPLGARAIDLASGPMSRNLALFWLGQARLLVGNMDGAVSALQEAAGEVIPGGDIAPIAESMLASLWHIRGDHERAAMSAERALEYTRSTASQGLWAWVLYDSLPYALVLGASGHHDEAIRFVRELLDEGGTTRGTGLRSAVVITLAGLAAQRGDHERACVLLGNAWRAILHGEGTRTPVDIAVFAHYDGITRSALDPDVHTELLALGDAMPPEDAISYGSMT